MGLTRPRAYQIFDIDYKQSVRVVTVSNVTLGGGAPSTVDGVSLSLNDRILVTAQSTGSQNGLYYVTTVGTGSNGTWARSVDGNQTGEIDAGMVVMVTEGNTYADTQWKLTTNDPIVIGSTALTFVQNYLANSISSGTSNVVVTANSNVSIAVAGSNAVVFSSGVQNITANIIPTANITYALGNTTNRFKDIWLANSSIYLGNVTISADSTQLLVNGTNVVTSSGGTTSLTGNITGGNLITGGLITATGNITGGNVRTGGLISAAGNITGANLSITADAVITGNLTVNGTTITVNSNTVTINDKFINVANNASTSTLANGGGLGVGPVGTEYATLTYDQAANTWDTNIGVAVTGIISATGNITGGNILGGANVNATTHTGTTVSVTANVTGGNILTSGLISATGNITGGNILGGANVNATTHTGTTVSVTANVTGGNLISSALVQGVTVSASGDVIGGNIVTVGAISTTGNAYVGNILTNGYYYANGVVFGGGGGGTPGGANTQIQFNDNGAFNGTTGFTFNKTTNAVATTGTLSATGNVTGGNILTSGLISATGNITGGNLSGTNLTGTLLTAAQTNVTSVGTLGSLTVTANIQGGNLRTAGQVSATGAITGAAITGSSLTVTTGNVTAGNLLISGAIVDSAQLDIQTSAANANIVLTPNGTGNVNLTRLSASGNIVAGNLIATNLTGTLLTASQTNITSVGTLSSLTVTANVQGGNLRTAGLISATGTVTGSSFSGAGTGLTGTAASLTVGAATSATTAATVTTAAQPNITSVGTLTSVSSSGAISATGNVTGGNIIASGASGNITGANVISATTINATGTITGGALATAGAITSASMTATGTVLWGSSASRTQTKDDAGSQASKSGFFETASPTNYYAGASSWQHMLEARHSNDANNYALQIAGSFFDQILYFRKTNGSGTTAWSKFAVEATTPAFAGITNSGSNGVGNIGSSTTYFNTVFAKATSAQYADLAEMYSADVEYAPGTVVEFGGTNEVTITTKSHSPAIAGIISTNPSYLMNSALECEHAVEVALTGRVPCQVVGTIRKGDRLVASELPGVATVLDMRYYEPGCIIGKALENYDSMTLGIIEVAVGKN